MLARELNALKASLAHADAVGRAATAKLALTAAKLRAVAPAAQQPSRNGVTRQARRGSYPFDSTLVLRTAPGLALLGAPEAVRAIDVFLPTSRAQTVSFTGTLTPAQSGALCFTVDIAGGHGHVVVNGRVVLALRAAASSGGRQQQAKCTKPLARGAALPFAAYFHSVARRAGAINPTGAAVFHVRWRVAGPDSAWRSHLGSQFAPSAVTGARARSA